jgi:hypothetical protein
MMIVDNFCVCDIETYTPTGTPDITVDELRYIGFLSKDDRKVVYHYTQREEIKKALNHFDYYVGHNFISYDKPVLERYGFNVGSFVVDTYEITDKRANAMMYIDLNKGDRSLRKLCERFNLEHKKGDFNYNLLKADTLDGKEYEDMAEYLYGDLYSTRDLFMYYYKFFYGFREFMNEQDQKKLCWLLSAPGATAYKCICHMAGIKEDYDDTVSGANKAYSGGFVLLPTSEYSGE